MIKPLELYIHIPFCIKKCNYCDFCSIPQDASLMETYCGALCREIERVSEQHRQRPISTLFIGGGTPSLIPPPLMEEILTALQKSFTFSENIEATCEMNPGTVTPDFLDVLKAYGINRLSLGAQAMQPHLLSMLGRIHNWEDVKTTVSMAKDRGFSNINLDLMFGLPSQTPIEWEETLHAALSLSPKHLSCYGLIVEEGTPMKTWVDEGRVHPLTDEVERSMYEATKTILRSAGMNQYEVSNFALAGYECRHNIGYWQGADYIGLGASAHSKMTVKGETVYTRYANTNNITEYIKLLGEGNSPIVSNELITNEEAMFETIMLGLRMTQGITAEHFLAEHHVPLEVAYGKQIEALSEKGLLLWDGSTLRLTSKGMDIQNTVLIALMPS